MRRRIPALGIGLLLALGQPISAGAAGQVAMTTCSGSLCFNPPAVTVPAGSSVSWSNQTALPHTVTSDSGAWPERIVDAGAGASITFSLPGTFPYHCRFHPSMVASVVVTPAAAVTTSPAATPSRLAAGGAGPLPLAGAILSLLGAGLLLSRLLRPRRV
jgi:plastocyanin